MSVLVTGATGLLGNNLVRHLLSHGQHVRVFLRETSPRVPIDGLDVEIFYGDIRDSESIDAACKGVDLVIHAAGYVYPGLRHADLVYSINITGTRNVSRASLRSNTRMVYISSLSALGIGNREHPADEEATFDGLQTPYATSKRQAEDVVHEYIRHGLSASIVNPGYMFGPWDWKPSSGKLLCEAATRFIPLYPRGGNNFCDVRDVVEGVLLAAERGENGRRYILGGDNLPYRDLFKIFSDVTGSRRPWAPLGPVIKTIAGSFGDLWGYLTGNELNVNSSILSTASLPLYYSSARAERELDYRHRPVRQAVEAAWTWFVEHGYV